MENKQQPQQPNLQQQMDQMLQQPGQAQPVQPMQPMNGPAKAKKKKNIPAIVLGVTTVLCAGAAVFCGVQWMNAGKTSDNLAQNTTASAETPADAPEAPSGEVAEVAKAEGSTYYLFDNDGWIEGRRYYLAFEKNGSMSENYLDEKTYLLDNTKLNTPDAVKEIDFADAMKPIYDKKIGALPSTLAAGTVNARAKSSCKSIDAVYLPADDGQLEFLEIDWNKEVPINVFYDCKFDGGELSLGTTLYVYNVDSNKIREIEGSTR